MIHINGLTFGYGGRTLFNDLFLHIRPGDRVALVGPNGMGKTTLFKIITGEIKGFDGNISARKECTVGMLPQDGIYDKGRTVMESTMEAFSEAEAIEREIHEIDKHLEDAREGGDYDELLKRSGELRAQFEHIGGFQSEARASMVLTGLGFSEEDLSRDVGTFSGGWQMRVALAKLLLKKPSILLLDEPTNHLDLPAIMWFETFLHTFEGAVVVISHDRMFLDKTTHRTVELTGSRLEQYDGNYSFYEVEKINRLEILRNRMENQAKEIKHTEQFIERFRYKATKARQVQSRIKMLEKIERIEIPDATKGLSFNFKANVQSGKSVLQLIDVNKSYGEKEVLRNVNLNIGRGDRIGVIGANGLGKSTLVRVIADRTEFQGARRVGHNVAISYFSQDQFEILTPGKTVLEEACDGASENFSGSIRGLLGVFLFSGDDVNKKVSMLSGGEKSRLLLAKMMACPANFLILDEPTNHLDPDSQILLEEVFKNYDGTICFVSHNRSFINSVATRIVEITKDGITEYIGNFDDYMHQKKIREEAALLSEATPGDQQPVKTDRKSERRERAKFVAERAKILGPIKNAIAAAEKSIEELEENISRIETELADPVTYNDPEKMKSLPAQLKQSKDTLEQTVEKWEALNDELSTKEKDFQE